MTDDLIERAEATLEVIKAPIIAELLAALKAAHAENEQLREERLSQQEAVHELARILHDASVRGDYEDFARWLVESGRVTVEKTFKEHLRQVNEVEDD